MVFDVITLGSATIDYFLNIEKSLKSVSYGEKVLISSLETHTGGGGTNSAVALSRMGLKTGYLGKLGLDYHAGIISKELREENVKLLSVKRHGVSAVSFILKSIKERDRIIYTHKGCSDEFRTKDFSTAKLKTNWFYLGTLVGASFKSAEKVAVYAKKNKINLMFNPSTYLAKKGKKFLSKILKATTIIVLNKEEAALLLKSRSKDEVLLAKKLYGLGIPLVVITNGSDRVIAYDGCFYSSKPYHVKVVHTAGAGDAFASGFLAAFIHKASIDTALSFGLANSASVIQEHGTKNKLLTWRQATNFIKKHHKVGVLKKC